MASTEPFNALPPRVAEPARIFVGCACVISDGHGRYLLVRETKEIARDRFAIPGGKIEFDETLEEAAVREVREETGLDVEIIDLLGIFHIPRTSEDTYGVNFVYSAAIVGGELATTPEHPEIIWQTTPEIDEMWTSGHLRGQHAGEAIRLLEAGVSLPRDLVRAVGPAPTRVDEL